MNESLDEIKKVSVKRLNSTIKNMDERPSIIIIDGTVTAAIIKAAEDAMCQIIVAKNFTTSDTNIKLLSL